MICTSAGARPTIRLAVLTCVSLLAFGACAATDHSSHLHPVPAAESAGTDGDHNSHDAHGHDHHSAGAAPATGPIVREPLPVAVEIPAIDVHADLIGLGLNDDGSMEVPDFGLAGWYTEGPPPGVAGPAVIAAHVDSVDGPDVFYQLRNLDPGDTVDVHREDGSTATFVVEAVEQHPVDQLPGDRIWAASSRPELTLITCGGAFDRDAGHYTENVIVFATAESPS